jgi:hypothetical protein
VDPESGTGPGSEGSPGEPSDGVETMASSGDRHALGLDTEPRIQYGICMKTITINVSEPVYRDFQEYAKRLDRKTSELIREAMEDYRERRMRPKVSVKSLSPLSLGKVLRPIGPRDDLLGEMLNAPRD